MKALYKLNDLDNMQRNISNEDKTYIFNQLAWTCCLFNRMIDQDMSELKSICVIEPHKQKWSDNTTQ